MTYSSTPNVNCPDQKSPAEVLLGRKMRPIFDLLKKPNIPQSKRNFTMENQYNKKTGAVHRKFNIDDLVYVKIYKNNSWRWEEGTVIDKIGNVNYSISTEQRTVSAHAN